MKSAGDVVAGSRLKIKDTVYDVVSTSDQAVTLKKLNSEKLILEYRVSLLIQKVEIWSS